MAQLTPESFWLFYKNEIKERGSWSAYQHASSWTPIAISAAEAVCRNQFALQTNREYFRIDVIGWTGPSDCDWDLKVAFEAEDSIYWEDELCKLAHIVSDLKVLVTYQARADRRAEAALDERLVRHKKRIMRVSNCKWLFIFGPYPKNRNDHWAAYTICELGQRMSLVDDVPLIGIHMKD